jgi:hypothetical protein
LTRRRHRADSKTAASATPDPYWTLIQYRRYFAANALALSATRAQPAIGSVQINLGELPPPAHAALIRRRLAEARAAISSVPPIRPGYASKPVPGPILDEDLSVEILFEEPFVLVGGGHSRWSRLRRVKFADLAGEPWVLPPYDSVPGRRIADGFRANNVEPPRPSMITKSGHLTAALVSNGHYLGLLPWSLVSVGLITIKNRTLSPLADRFIACVRDIGRLLTMSTKGFKARSTMRVAAK